MRAWARHSKWELSLATSEQRPVSALGDQVIQALTKLASMPFLPGNRVRLLINGIATFTAIFAAIRAARVYVIVQFFTGM